MSRRLTLRHGGRVFLDRWGLECHWFGIFVHKIAAPDPGLDLHDHPWPFVSLILRGGYAEQVAEAREPWLTHHRSWGRGSVHRMPMTAAHRITFAEPGTWTLVLRGRKSRTWGFYLADESRWTPWDHYDYATRRPVDAGSSDVAERQATA